MLTNSDLQKIVALVDNSLETILDKKLKPIKKDINYIKKSVNLIVKNYDEADSRLEKRVKRIEDHLSLPN